MINFTNRGKRLAVMKLTDGETDRMVGRIQARFANQVWNYHVERKTRDRMPLLSTISVFTPAGCIL